MTPDQIEAFEERAAIMEFDGGLLREEAETEARRIVLEEADRHQSRCQHCRHYPGIDHYCRHGYREASGQPRPCEGWDDGRTRYPDMAPTGKTANGYLLVAPWTTSDTLKFS